MYKSSVDVAPNPSSSADSSSSSSSSSQTSSSSLHPAAATRKTLHQNIIGKLRPLPFQYRWTIWFDRHTEPNNNVATSGSGSGFSPAAGDTTYSDRLYVLHEDIADIATFYRVYNNYPWHQIRLRDTVHIFRKGVKPLWEDPENLHGGSWTFRVPKAKSQAFFHEVAILTLANELQSAIESEHDHVLGLSMSVRFNSHLISIWNKNGDNERSVKAIEETVRDRLSPELRPVEGSGITYFYKKHSERDGWSDIVAAARKQQESQESG